VALHIVKQGMRHRLATFQRVPPVQEIVTFESDRAPSRRAEVGDSSIEKDMERPVGIAGQRGCNRDFTRRTIAVGSHAITVKYLGDTIDLGSTSQALTQKVNA